MVRVRGLEPPEHGFLDRSLCHSGTPAYVLEGFCLVAKVPSEMLRYSLKFSKPITTILLRNSDKYLIGWLDLSEEYIGGTSGSTSAPTATCRSPIATTAGRGYIFSLCNRKVKSVPLTLRPIFTYIPQQTRLIGKSVDLRPGHPCGFLVRSVGLEPTAY